MLAVANQPFLWLCAIAAFAAISLGGAMWMIDALVLTPLLKKGNTALTHTNPTLLAIRSGRGDACRILHPGP